MNKNSKILLAISSILLIVFLLIIFFVVGCQKQQTENTQAEELNLRGFFYYGPEVNTFRECDDEKEYWVTGDVGINIWKLYTDLVPEMYLPVYVEMKAEIINSKNMNGDYAGLVVIKELYHMAYETLGCELEKKYNFLLHGNEPFWKVVIDEERGVFLEILGEEEVYAPYVVPKKIDNGFEYTLISGNRPMVIKIRKFDNYDSMSGAYYGYSSYVSFKDKIFYGQALIGRPLF